MRITQVFFNYTRFNFKVSLSKNHNMLASSTNLIEDKLWHPSLRSTRHWKDPAREGRRLPVRVRLPVGLARRTHLVLLRRVRKAREGTVRTGPFERSMHPIHGRGRPDLHQQRERRPLIVVNAGHKKPVINSNERNQHRVERRDGQALLVLSATNRPWVLDKAFRE